MKTLLAIPIILLVLNFSVSVFPQKVKWQPINPVISKLEDVEKLLGKPKSDAVYDDGTVSYLYYLKNYNFEVRVANGVCKENQVDNWNFEKDTIISVKYILGDKGRFKFSKLKVDLNKYTKEYFVGSHTPDHFYYFSDEEGIKYHGENEWIYDIEFYPSSKFQDLRCDNALNFDCE